MAFSFQGEGGLEIAAARTHNWSSSRRKQEERGGREPCSVLDNRSPSPPTSTSTLSSSLAGGGGGGGGSSYSAGVAAISDTNPAHKWQQQQPPSAADKNKEEWAFELQPIPPSLSDPKCGVDGLDEWEAVLSESAAAAASPSNHEQTFLRWIMGDIDDSNHLPIPPSQSIQQEFEPFCGLIDPSFASFDGPSALPPISPPPAPINLPTFFQEPINDKPHHHLQPPTFFLPPPPLPERHRLAAPSPAPYGFQQRPPPKPKEEQQQMQQALVGQLLRAAELVEAGNPFSAREILARLNQQIPPSPLGLPPLLRSASLFKDALSLLAGAGHPSAPLANPWDVVLKLSSYKAFSEVSPLLHFSHFTVTQTLLEELSASDRIHIVDFDIGVGGQWSSFMQELSHRRPRSTPPPLLRITAFVSPSSSHPLELHLTRSNLSHFASDLGLPFELSFLSVDSFDPSELLADEAVAVILPAGSHYPHPFPALLRLVKQLNPRIVVSVDHMLDRADLPFAHHLLHSFQSCMVLLDSLDAAGASADTAGKIERLLVYPRVESAVVGRHRAGGRTLPPWRAVFASAGFVPCQLSSFAEAQAECLLKRVQVRGFHVEKRQSSLFLYWQRGELGSVSAWKC